MVNLHPPYSSVDYMEELTVGESPKPGTFDAENKKLCLLSDKDVLFYDTMTGQRLHRLTHSDRVIGIKLHSDNLLVSITDGPEICVWEIESHEIKKKRKLNIPDGYKAAWTYDQNKDIFLLLVKEEGEHENNEDSVLVKFAIDQLFNENTNQTIRSKFVVHTGKRPEAKKYLVLGDDFYVKCQGKRLIMVNFAHTEDEIVPDSDNETGRKNSSKIREFVLKSRFHSVEQKMVEFDGVWIAGSSLFATVNVGRIYAWSRFIKCGISFSNCSFVTLTGHQIMLTATTRGTTFIGTGDGLLFKYNISGASGVGRWHRLEQLNLESPPRSLMLSTDFTVLVAILADNTVCIFQTSRLKLISKAKVVKKSQTNWLGIISDPANSDYICTNSRIGYLQWIDPLQCKTAFEVDVSEENLPPEDTFNRPDFLWLDVYLAYLSIPRVVTCECRRNDSEKTHIKFWRRLNKEQLELENSFVIPQRILFICSTLDEYWDKSSVTAAFANSQEFLVISATSELEVYFQDSDSKGFWRKDLKRHTRNWQQFKIKHCSLIRNQQFCTVNLLRENSHVLIWNLTTLTVSHQIDTLKCAEQVEWSPQPSILLITCQNGITAYDSSRSIFVWSILQPKMSIFSNHLTTFAHSEHNVFVINPETGTFLKERNPLKFSRPQKEIIAIGTKGNIGFCGITKEGFISVLKPAAELAQNTIIQNGAKSREERTTAFSQLIANGEIRKKRKQEEEVDGPNNQKRPSNSIMLMEMPSIKRFMDGPAHSLPPITQLACQFVQACLAKRH